MEILLGAGCNVKNNQDSNGAQHEGILMNSSNISVYFMQISKFLRKYIHLGKYNYPRDRKETLRKFYPPPIEFFRLIIQMNTYFIYSHQFRHLERWQSVVSITLPSICTRVYLYRHVYVYMCTV